MEIIVGLFNGRSTEHAGEGTFGFNGSDRRWKQLSEKLSVDTSFQPIELEAFEESDGVHVGQPAAAALSTVATLQLAQTVQILLRQTQIALTNTVELIKMSKTNKKKL